VVSKDLAPPHALAGWPSARDTNGYVMVVTDANRKMAAVASLIAIYFLYCGFAIRRYFRRSYQNDRRFPA